MMFLAVLFYIYCIIGAVVGIVYWIDGNWPAKKMIKDTVGGLGSYMVTDINRTVLFAILCGPLFWIVGLFFLIFKFIVSLLKEEE